MENEHTLYHLVEEHDGITHSIASKDVDELLALVRERLASGLCVKLSIDKYTPDADELRGWAEMDAAN